MNEDLGEILEGALPRRVMTLFMLIDTSGSMRVDGNIGKVNRAVEETIQQLRDISDDNFDAEIRVAIMSFANDCQWITSGAVPIDEAAASWNDLNANGVTAMGEAFKELERKLSRSQFLASSTGAYAPVLILLSDGMPSHDITPGLEALQHNNWYKVATKIAIAVDGAAEDALQRFTGNPEHVIRYDSDRQDLQTLITTLAVVSSKMQSHSRGANDMGEAVEKGDSIAADIKAGDEVATVAIETALEQSAIQANPNPGGFWQFS